MKFNQFMKKLHYYRHDLDNTHMIYYHLEEINKYFKIAYYQNNKKIKFDKGTVMHIIECLKKINELLPFYYTLREYGYDDAEYEDDDPVLITRIKIYEKYSNMILKNLEAHKDY